MKIALFHFLPIEDYPPVLNSISRISQIDQAELTVVTVSNKKEPGFKFRGVKISRPAALFKTQSSLSRYFNYLKFDVLGFLTLLIKMPSIIIYYDVLSVLPVYWYVSLFKSTKLMIHYHEYVSPDELSAASRYVQYLHLKELALYSKAAWISQTNEKRIELFKADNPDIIFNNLQILPNFPPASWAGVIVKPLNTPMRPVKFVYVGALSLETMFVKQFAEWIKNMHGNCVWDIYSTNHTASVIAYLSELNCNYITFKGGVGYNELPLILPQYNIGVILYKGVSPNHVHSASNKLFEYLVCDLDVWFPKTIIGSYPYENTETFPKVIAVDFEKMAEIDLDNVIDRTDLNYKGFNFSAEESLRPLICNLLQSDESLN